MQKKEVLSGLRHFNTSNKDFVVLLLFVGWFICVQDYSKTTGWIITELAKSR